MYQMQFCWGFFCWVFFVRGMHQDGVYNNYRMCKAPNDVLYSSPLHQTFGYHINSLLVVFNSTSRISSAWIILIKVMLKQKNANGDCHVFAIIFNTLLLQTFGLHITVTNLLWHWKKMMTFPLSFSIKLQNPGKQLEWPDGKGKHWSYW